MHYSHLPSWQSIVSVRNPRTSDQLPKQTRVIMVKVDPPQKHALNPAKASAAEELIRIPAMAVKHAYRSTPWHSQGGLRTVSGRVRGCLRLDLYAYCASSRNSSDGATPGATPSIPDCGGGSIKGKR